MLRILGIDPGTARVGFALVDYDKTNTIDLIDCGVIETCKTKEDAVRLTEIRDDLEELIDKYQPEVLAVEKLFFFKNPKTIIPVAQARGVIVEIAQRKNLKIFEYTPLEMKKIITGNGMASKDQVSDMVHSSLGIEAKIKPDDAVDAVGLALSFVRNDYAREYTYR
jgi:crossover junction endodeoxyribonuclease RuvC